VQILDFYHATEHLAEVARGLHIGSGIAESSCKNLVQARLKQSGMHWTVEGAESILQLRRLWLDVQDANFAHYARMTA